MINKRLFPVFLVMAFGCAEADGPDAAAGPRAGSHCAFNTDTQETRCFSSLQGAAAFATEGAIANAADVHELGERLANAPLDKRGGSLGTGPSVTAILYQDWYFTGATFIFFGTRCEGQVPRLENYGMGDQITSLQVFQGCALTLWKDAGFRGLRVTTTSYFDDLGGYSDAASSARVHYPNEEQTSL